MVANQHILYIHIPKTAGTSFRAAAEEYYHKDNIFYDYSPHFKETSKCVLEMIYAEQNHYKLYEHISRLEYSFFSGHFQVNRYSPLYETLNIVTFVRSPVEQVLSHYNHYKNYHNYDKDLNSFIREPRFRNLQSKVLKGKPLNLYGFLGLTEEYRVSIEMFNALYNLDLQYKRINIKGNNSLNIEDLDDEILNLIVQLNEKDIDLYKVVKKQFKVRKELYEKNLPFTYGFIQKITENNISGIAVQKDNDEAIEIDIYAGKRYLETVVAKNFRPGQVQNNVPRRGFIGFDFTYKSHDVLNGKLHAYVKQTGQKII